MSQRRRGVFPGSFDPLTTAHLAIAEVAVRALGLDGLDLVMSGQALAKDPAAQASLPERLAAIDRAAGERPWLRTVVTPARLLADIAEGYDVCVLGADKWHQLHDPAFYAGSPAGRDAAVARLPLLAVAPRAGAELPPPGPGLIILELDPSFREVSSTAVRSGREDWRA
jgi:hypothetical protein